MAGIIVGRDPLVRRRVVAGGVDAVEDAAELIVAAAEDGVQTVGEGGVLQFLRVGGGNGVHRIRAEDGSLQKVHVPVHKDGAVLRPAFVKTEEVPQRFPAIAALVLDIMDAEHRPDGAVAGVPDAVVLQVDGDQRRLPVVAVDDVRPELQVVQHFHHCPGEKAEALAVIGIAIEPRAAEVLLVIQEVPGDALPLQGEESAVAVPPAKVHIVITEIPELTAKALLHAPVEGQDHRGLRPLRRQGGWQGARHIREAPGLAEGDRLAGSI